MEPIIPIDRVKREAVAAAAKFTNVNDACPYPFHTDAGRMFRLHFEARRELVDKLRQADARITPRAITHAEARYP